MAFLRSLTATPERRIAFALLLLIATLYVPFAGNYGMWDPWETHYSEVARQMLQRHDFVSLWWPGSPQDRNEFWSKPVLTFWMIAIGFGVAGLERAAHQFDGEMAIGWTAEWAARIPFILCGIACAWATWELTRRLAGRRAGMWSAIVLATSSQFFFVSRQAMTDMAFVAPIAVALAFAGLAILLPKEEIEAELPRRGSGRLTWPHAPAFYAMLGMVLLVCLPQLLVCGLQTTLGFTVGRKAIKMTGFVAMLPWIAALAGFLWWGARARTKKQIYLYIAYLMCGLSTLAKGPAGIGLPVIVILLYLVSRGEWKAILPPPADPTSPSRIGRMGGPIGFLLRFALRHPLELGLGTLLFAAVACPWYHAMLIKHGMGFWNEFIGDNYVHRAAGRHGDRGTFEYYVLQIGHGMFPWCGFVATALLTSLARLKGDDQRTKLRAFALVWFLVMFATMSLVNTKFHHYILPGLPALAILVGLLVDDLFARPSVADALALLFAGVPVLALSARDLAMFPARLPWLFDYDYVNAPNGGRPWPTTPEYDYSMRIGVWGVFVVAAMVAYGLSALVRARAAAKVESDDDAQGLSPLFTWLLVLAPIATTAIAALWEPPFGEKPMVLANGWILVGVAGGLFVLALVGKGLAKAPGPTAPLVAFAVVACLWTGWGLDRLLTDLSPHWSQKQVIASYYMKRSGPEEPLIAWQMYWRGENFYTKNAIYDHRIEQKDKTVFLGDHNAEKMQEYFKTHAGRRVFFIVERTRFEALRALLPEAAKSTLKAVDDSNNKIYLAVAQI